MLKHFTKSNVLAVCLAFFCLAALLAMFSKTIADPDIWGHVLFGKDILASANPIQVDAYSYLTQGTKWINHEWLSEVTFYLAYKAADMGGLCLLRLGLDLAILILLFFYLLAEGLSVLSAALVLLLAGQMLITGINTLRPQIFSDLLLLFELLLIRKADQGKYAFLFCLPLLFAFWVNLHGGYLAGLACLFAWALFHWLFVFLKPKPRASVSFAITILALFLTVLALAANPYGFELTSFLLKTATKARPDIPEWAPVAFNTWPGAVYLFSVFASLALLLKSKTKLSPGLAAILLPLAFAPIFSRRHMQLFAIAMVVLLPEQIREVQSFVCRSNFKQWLDKWPGLLTALISLIICVPASALVWFAAQDFDKLIVVHRYPFAACVMLKRLGLGGNLVVAPMYWGEFVIWKLAPLYKVSFDGRRETCYSDKMQNLNLDFAEGRAQWQKLLDDYPSEFCLIDRQLPCFKLLSANKDWSLIYLDQVSAVYVKKQFAVRRGLPWLIRN